MAQFPRRRALHLSRLLAALPLLAPVGAAAQVGLEGTWHVLVHYTDDNSPHPEQERWLDRVWVFKRKGSRLEWVEYPIAVFNHESGRFERRGTGQYARVLGSWQPDAEQLGNIREGVRVNTRGMKRKSLRGSDSTGWNTTSRARASSASVITYQENWRIEAPAQLPVFVQEDVMGSGRSETLEGVTRYETAALEEGVDLLVGSYERDGTKHGSFQLRRSGPIRGLEEKSQAEIQAAGARRGMATSQVARDIVGEELEQALLENGITLTEAELDAIVTESITLYLSGVEGSEFREKLQERLQRGVFSWARPKAVHDDSVRYRLPFASDTPRRAVQVPAREIGEQVAAAYSRSTAKQVRESLEYVAAFDMPEGERVVAARAGEVVRVSEVGRDGRPSGGDVTVLHEDGSFAQYSSLKEGVSVKQGDRLEAGDPVGQSGTMRAVGAPMLFFGVFVLDGESRPKSLPVRFDDGSAEGAGVVPGELYGGERSAEGP